MKYNLKNEKFVRKKKLGKQDFHYDAKKRSEATKKAGTETNEEIIEEFEAKTKATVVVENTNVEINLF